VSKRGLESAGVPWQDAAVQKLQSAGLRPTLARVAILQMLADDRGKAMSAEAVFQQLVGRGTAKSLGTVYRVLQELEQGGLLLREWHGRHRSLYRIMPGAGMQAPRLVCRSSGHDVALADPLLDECLQADPDRSGLSG
jgi:Fur family ferric uptake transcriptional regulator